MSLNASQPVVLEAAFAWACPSCDAENFCRGARERISGKKLKEFLVLYAQMHPDSEPDPGMVVYQTTTPTSVKCKACGGVFRATEPRS